MTCGRGINDWQRHLGPLAPLPSDFARDISDICTLHRSLSARRLFVVPSTHGSRVRALVILQRQPLSEAVSVRRGCFIKQPQVTAACNHKGVFLVRCISLAGWLWIALFKDPEQWRSSYLRHCTTEKKIKNG